VPSPRDLLTIRIHTLYTSYVNVTPSGVNAFTWAGSTTDVRALLKAASSTDRIPATWFNPPFFLIDIAFNDGLQHRAAIYCLDWDGARRADDHRLRPSQVGCDAGHEKHPRDCRRCVIGVAEEHPVLERHAGEHSRSVRKGSDSFCDRRPRDSKGRHRSTQQHFTAPGAGLCLQTIRCRRRTFAPLMDFHDGRNVYPRGAGVFLATLPRGDMDQVGETVTLPATPPDRSRICEPLCLVTP
jgi:hypothetical protein